MRCRTLTLLAVAVAALVFLAGRLAWFQVVKAEEVLAREEAWRLQQAALTPVRGAILDREGRYLAVSVPVRNVVASPYHIKEEHFEEVAAELAPLLGMEPEALVRQFAENASSQYLPIAKGIDLETAAEIQKRGLRGISLEAGALRTYPQGSVANQVIGYLNYEGEGVYGLEARYEEQLKGKPGYVRAELTHTGDPIEGTVKGQVDPEPGLNLITTIDAHLTQIFEERLDRAIAETDAKRALAIAMDVRTGEILAMAMRPGASLSDRSTWLGPDGQMDFGRINNWAVEPLPPGSIFKTITTAVALEEGVIDLTTLIPDPGYLEIDGWRVTNWDQVVPEQPRAMTIAELLQASSNVGLIQVGERIPRETFIKYLRAFGFMGPTGLDFSHESGATGLTDFEEKRRIDWANMYIGQHLEVTPLQMVRAVAAIANGGHLVQPHLVKEIRTPDGEVVWKADTRPGHQVISAQTAAEVRELLVSVIEERYQQARVEGYTAGGKTGTAQKFEGGVEKARGLGDFIGFAPASDPRVVLMVLIDEPRPPGYGGVIAAPVFADLMPHVLRSLGVPADRPVAAEPEPPAGPRPEEPPTALVPEVRYLPVAWAEQKLTDAGFVPKLAGQGRLVEAQSLPAGERAKVGAEVELTLTDGSPDAVRVPDLRGLTLAEASRLAAEVGIALKQADGSGFVVEQSVPVGGEVAPGTVITVRLSAVRY